MSLKLHLDVIKEFRLSKCSSGQCCRRIVAAMMRLEVEGLLPAHPLAENGPPGLELAMNGGRSYVSAALELVNQRVADLESY